MRNAKSYKLLLFLLLTGWCLLFLRCESTEKSMVRAVYLAQSEQGYQAGLLYQAPQAAADAADVTAALQFVQAEGQTMERALDAAEQALPQTASYRLCDYLLLSKAEEPLLTEYEQLVLRRGCGRTAARLLCAEGEIDRLAAQAALPDALMAQLKTAAPTARCPRRRSSNSLRRSARRFCKAAGSRAWMCCTCKPGQRCGTAAAQVLTQQKTPARNCGQTCISCCIKRQWGR